MLFKRILFGMVAKRIALLLLFLCVFSLSAEDLEGVSIKDVEISSDQQIDFSATDEKKDEIQLYFRSFFGFLYGEGYSYLGASLSVVPWKSLEITFGGGDLVCLFCGISDGYMLFSKIGWSFEFDFRTKESGVILRLPLALGWRYVTTSQDYVSEQGGTRRNSLNLSFGIELIVMFNKVFGISFHQTLFADLVVSYRYYDFMGRDIRHDAPPEKSFFYLDGGVINFVFRF